MDPHESTIQMKRRIREKRLDSNITVTQAAANIEVTKSWYSRIESGYSNDLINIMFGIERFSTALNCSPADIIEIIEESIVRERT